MSKIERYQGNVQAFASASQGLERTVFGGTEQANDLTSQITAAFLRGWGVVGPSEHPSLEDFNAAMYAMSQFIAYQHQAGVPEWHEEQEYFAGSICTHSGESYQSLADSNVGNEPPSAQWTPILTSNNGLQNLGLGIRGIATFTASGSWTCPEGVTTVYIDACGGGGGGAYSSPGATGGGGGGGAAAVIGVSISVTPGTTYEITVGGPGAAGTPSSVNGVAGGTTSFGRLLVLNGGGGGLSSAGAGTGGGTGGNAGTAGALNGGVSFGGAGGGCVLGNGGAGGNGAMFGTIPGQYGGGGGGGANGGSGARGAYGILKLRW